MFVKLLKYEWSAMIRKMLPVYAATLVIALINGLLWGGAGQGIEKLLPETIYTLLQVLMIFLYFAVLVGLCVVTFLFLVERFYKGLLKEEGYLMFTLPVRAWQLVLSKAIVAFLVSLLSVFIGVCSFTWLVMGAPGGLLALPRAIFDLLHEGLVYSAGMEFQALLIILEFLLLIVASGFSAIYHFYFSMSLGQLSRSHRVLWSVVWYIVLYVVLSTAGWGLLMLLMWWISSLDSNTLLQLQQMIDRIAATEAERGIVAAHIVLLSLLFMELICLMLEVLPTHWIMGHRLNLE